MTTSGYCYYSWRYVHLQTAFNFQGKLCKENFLEPANGARAATFYALMVDMNAYSDIQNHTLFAITHESSLQLAERSINFLLAK